GARRSWHRRWAEVLEDNPGVLAGDPALLAIAEHWHQARDVRRALAATVAAIPAAERVCLPAEETMLWARVLRAFGHLDDAEAVAGMTLRDAWGRGLLAVTLAKRSLREEFRDAVPLDRLTPAERAAAALLAEDDHAKGEANLLPDESVREAMEAFEESPADELAVVVWAAAGSRARDVARGTELVNRALDGARSLGARRAVFLCAAMGSYQAQITGDPAGAVELLRRALQDYPDDAWPGAVGCIGNLVWCEAIMGRHAEARAAAEDGFARLPRPHLSVEAWEHLTENACFSWILTGHWERARSVLEEAAPWWDDDVRSSSARLDVLDLAQRGAADVDRWRARVDDPAPGGAPQALVRELLARAAALDGDLPGMRSVLMPAWTDDLVLFNADQLAGTAVFAARTEADAALAGPRTDRAEALAHLDTIAEVTATFPRYGPLGDVWPVALSAELDRFHGRDARPALRAALEGWERIGHVPDVGATHLSLAEQEAIHGDRSAARDHLAAAREIAERLEAVPMLERADALAERYALTSRERRTDDVLTEREVEVLRLVADGMTNGQIGTRLFMSPKTASVHVSHILAKLGAANRTEAATLARRQGLLAD
ncbi:MAG TPA: response regulator transcription factor, partial [Nocardioides sp.]